MAVMVSKFLQTTQLPFRNNLICKIIWHYDCQKSCPVAQLAPSNTAGCHVTRHVKAYAQCLMGIRKALNRIFFHSCSEYVCSGIFRHKASGRIFRRFSCTSIILSPRRVGHGKPPKCPGTSGQQFAGQIHIPFSVCLRDQVLPAVPR